MCRLSKNSERLRLLEFQGHLPACNGIESHCYLYLLAYKMIKTLQCKGTLVQALRLSTGRTAHRGSRGIALLFLDHGTRRGWVVSSTPRPLFTPGKDPEPIVHEDRWAPGPVWTGAENLAPTGIRSPDRPAPSQSLYWLSYRAHKTLQSMKKLDVTCNVFSLHFTLSWWTNCFKLLLASLLLHLFLW